MQGQPSILILRSNPVDPDPRVEKLAGTFSGIGHKVTVLGWDRTGRLPSREEKPYGVVHRLAIPARFGRGIYNSVHLLRFEAGLLRWLVLHHSEYEILHACDFDTVLPALLVRRLWKKKVVYDIFDFYAEMLRATPDFLKRLIRRVDLWAIGRADALILADDSRLEQVRSSRPRRISVICNSPEDYRPDAQASADRRPRSSSQLRVAFVGLLQVERGLLELLEVLSQHPEWSLDLAGFGGDERPIVSRANKLENVRFHGRVSYQAAMVLNSRADALIATYDPRIPNHRYASPNKLFEAMMLAKPIIVAEGTNMDLIVSKAGCGVVVPYADLGGP